MESVLFVCTGNVFRSLTAEYALRRALLPGKTPLVRSAGSEGGLHRIHPFVWSALRARGLDVSGHCAQPLSRKLLAESALVVAMGKDHQEHLANEFGVHAPLFNEVCFSRAEGVLDIHEAVVDWQRDDEGSREYVEATIDYIIGAMPAFVSALEQ
jgi:protein-tyrosine phosphatase